MNVILEQKQLWIEAFNKYYEALNADIAFARVMKLCCCPKTIKNSLTKLLQWDICTFSTTAAYFESAIAILLPEILTRVKMWVILSLKTVPIITSDSCLLKLQSILFKKKLFILILYV